VSTIHKNTLPKPSTVAQRVVPVRNVTRAGPMLFSRTVDAQQVERTLFWTYRDVSAQTADAIRRHYREHATEEFLVVLPRTGEEVVVMYETPPTVTWTSAASASVAMELKVMLAHS
jgi:hypothetical protein